MTEQSEPWKNAELRFVWNLQQKGGEWTPETAGDGYLHKDIIKYED